MLYARGIVPRLAMIIATAAGCATATTPLEGSDAAPNNGPDAPRLIDAPEEQPIDAPAPCTPMMTQLLVNPGLDLMPAGMGWTQTPINPATPIITADDGNSAVVEQSPTMKVWMGGYAQAVANDSLTQDVVIPMNTTALELTGFYWIKSSDSTFLPYDTLTFTVENGATVIGTVLSKDNTTRHTAWTPISYTIPAAGLSGQTIRLKIVTHNDDSLTTSFWFDTFALTATHCQ
jgi:hypothetical protein